MMCLVVARLPIDRVLIVAVLKFRLSPQPMFTQSLSDNPLMYLRYGA